MASSPARLAALRDIELAGIGAQEAFDRLSRLACRILGTPVSMITLVGDDRQYVKSQIGLPEVIASSGQIPLSHAICHHTISLGVPLILQDTHTDEVFAQHPAVLELGVRAYLGAPLTSPEGEQLGAVCAMDSQPHAWSPDDVKLVSDLAAMTMVEIRRNVAQRGLEREQREKADILEQAARTKTEFLVVMGREIRSPISAVLGMTEMMLDDDVTDAHREMLQVIRTSGEHVNTALTEMLHVAKLEGEQLNVGPTTHVRLTSQVRELLDANAGLASR